MLILGPMGPYILNCSDLQSSLVEHNHQDNHTQLCIESVAHRVSLVDQSEVYL